MAVTVGVASGRGTWSATSRASSPSIPQSDDDRVRDAGHGDECLLDFVHFDAVASQLHLVVLAPHGDEAPIWSFTSHVAGTGRSARPARSGRLERRRASALRDANSLATEIDCARRSHQSRPAALRCRRSRRSRTSCPSVRCPTGRLLPSKTLSFLKNCQLTGPVSLAPIRLTRTASSGAWHWKAAKSRR